MTKNDVIWMVIIILVAAIGFTAIITNADELQDAMQTQMNEAIMSSLEGAIERDLGECNLHFVLTDAETTDGTKGIIIYDDNGNVISTNVRGFASENGPYMGLFSFFFRAPYTSYYGRKVTPVRKYRSNLLG
jgi:hypothetical protein